MDKIIDKIGYICLYSAIISTVTSQLLVKWRIANKISYMFPMPDSIMGKLVFILKILFDPVIFISCCLTLIGGLLWIGTLTKLEISYAYPVTMLGFIAVLILSIMLFGESVNIYKILGCIIIIIGVIITSRGL